MSDIVDTNLGPVAIAIGFTGGKLQISAGDAALGLSLIGSADGIVLVKALQALLDGKFPNEKGAIDLVLGMIESAIQAA